MRKILATKESIDQLLGEGQELIKLAKDLLNEARDNFIVSAVFRIVITVSFV